jgi:antitoxin PrlF
VVIQPGHYDFTSFRASIRLWSLSRRLTFPYPEARKIMIKSKLTSKSQTTIPQPVRLALGLEPGDEVVYEIEEGRVVVRKAGAVAVDDPFATFNEWSGTADREAYGDL